MYKTGIFSEEENEFLKLNYKKLTYKEIGNILNRTESSVHDRLQKLKLKKANKKIWSDDEIKTLIEFYNKTPDVFKMFPNRSRQSISYKAHSLGLKKDNRGEFSVNYDFFKTWDEEMAYILGMICADGNLCSDKIKRVTITLHEDDKYMLEKISSILQSNRPIFKRKSKCNDLVILNNVIYDDLVNLGLTPKKSLTLKWIENIPKDMLRHFVRGYIDGDGCICSYIRTRKGFREKPDYLENVLEVSMLGTPDFLNGLSEEVSKSLNIKKIKNSTCSTVNFESKAFRMKWTGITALKVLDWIYKDSNIHLDRKLNKYHKYIQDTCSKA